MTEPDPAEARVREIVSEVVDEKLKGFGESLTEAFHGILDERLHIEDDKPGEGGGTPPAGDPPPAEGGDALSPIGKLLGLAPGR